MRGTASPRAASRRAPASTARARRARASGAGYIPAMTLPMALVILLAIHWPATLVLALIAAALGAYVRGGWRVVWFVIAGLLLGALALGGPLLAEWGTVAPG